MDRRRVVVAAVAVADGNDGRGARPGLVDFEGVRFDVPDDYVVQDIAGRVDGQLACPDAPGFVLADDADRPFYTGASCDPPGDEVVVRLFVNPDMAPAQAGPRAASPGGVEYVTFEPTSLVFVASEVWLTVEAP